MLHRKSKGHAILELAVILYLFYCATIVFLVAPPLLLKAVGIHLGLRLGTMISLGCILIAEVIVLAGVSLYYRRKGIQIRQLGWKLPENSMVVGVLALSAGALYIWYSSHLPEIGENLSEISMFKLWGLVAGAGGAVMEEIIFRGYIMTHLEQVKITPKIQVLLTAITFSLIHLGFGLTGMLCTFLLGAALGGLYLLGRRSLFGPALCHVAINAVLEPWLLLWLLRFYSEKFAS